MLQLRCCLRQTFHDGELCKSQVDGAVFGPKAAQMNQMCLRTEVLAKSVDHVRFLSYFSVNWNTISGQWLLKLFNHYCKKQIS